MNSIKMTYLLACPFYLIAGWWLKDGKLPSITQYDHQWCRYSCLLASVFPSLEWGSRPCCNAMSPVLLWGLSERMWRKLKFAKDEAVWNKVLHMVGVREMDAAGWTGLLCPNLHVDSSRSLARHPAFTACKSSLLAFGTWGMHFLQCSVPACPCKPRPCPARGKEMNLPPPFLSCFCGLLILLS